MTSNSFFRTHLWFSMVICSVALSNGSFRTILYLNINILNLSQDEYIFLEIVFGILLASLIMYIIVKLIINILKYND
jgi:hypothetical protein